MAATTDFFQIFVRLLDTKTLALQLPLHPQTPTTVETLTHLIHSLSQIPIHLQTLTLNGNLLNPHTPIPSSLRHSTLRLHLPLLGGKGGFGSLLRGAATKAGQKKTNNFDACRDMSGRRLRHVNAEKRIEEWVAGEEERKLEKAAEVFLKKVAVDARKKRGGGDGGAEKYVERYREESARCVESVERSVRESVGEVLVGKRKRMMERRMGKEDLDSKKAKIWMGKRVLAESDSDETDEDENHSDDAEKERSVVIDNGSQSDSSKEPEGSSHVSSAKLFDTARAERSSENGSEEEKDSSNEGSSEASGSPDGVAKGIDQDEMISGCQDQQLSCAVSEVETEASAEPIVCQPSNNSASEELVETESAPATAVMDTPIVSTDVPEIEDHPVNLDDISSATELEVLGLEKLKTELQARGLKCGGTVQERAARLFLLKTTPIEKLPKKLFAKK